MPRKMDMKKKVPKSNQLGCHWHCACSYCMDEKNTAKASPDY